LFRRWDQDSYERVQCKVLHESLTDAMKLGPYDSGNELLVGRFTACIVGILN
jgi:hypothetical protein